MPEARAAETRPRTGEPDRRLRGVGALGLGKRSRRNRPQTSRGESRPRGGLEEDQCLGVGSGEMGDLPSLLMC